MKCLYARIGLIIVLFSFTTIRYLHASPLYSLTLNPQTGNLTLAPGSTGGWGYKIINNSSYFLVPTSMDADIVFDGILLPLFDFPVVAPRSILEREYIRGETGLFEFTWNTDAPSLATNNGHFSLNAQFFTNDPLIGGSYLMEAGQVLSHYSLSMSSIHAVPEPPPIFLLVPMLIGLAWWGRAARNN